MEEFPNCEGNCRSFEEIYLDYLFRFNDNLTYSELDEKGSRISGGG